MTTFRRTTLAVLAAAAAVAALPAAGSAAPKAPTTCAPKPGTLAVAPHGYGRVWHRGTSLYGCTTAYGHAPKVKRMGPYAPGTKVSFDGSNLAWTVPMRIDGVGTDRVWAGNVDSGRRWMLAQKPNPGGASKPQREGRVQRIIATDRAVAWVTKGGDVVGALEEEADAPAAIGTLPAPPVALGNLTVVGSWPDVDPQALGGSLRLVEEDGDGDECGGVNPYALTVVPDPAAGPVGVRRSGYWTSTNCS